MLATPDAVLGVLAVDALPATFTKPGPPTTGPPPPPPDWLKLISFHSGDPMEPPPTESSKSMSFHSGEPIAPPPTVLAALAIPLPNFNRLSAAMPVPTNPKEPVKTRDACPVCALS